MLQHVFLRRGEEQHIAPLLVAHCQQRAVEIEREHREAIRERSQIVINIVWVLNSRQRSEVEKAGQLASVNDMIPQANVAEGSRRTGKQSSLAQAYRDVGHWCNILNKEEELQIGQAIHGNLGVRQASTRQSGSS